jgi:hypothetical protein
MAGSQQRPGREKRRGPDRKDYVTTARYSERRVARRFGSSQAHLVEMVPSIARIAIECIGNYDALHHNVEHTMLVTLARHDILRGRVLYTHMPA